jgi:GxxExxY protein
MSWPPAAPSLPWLTIRQSILMQPRPYERGPRRGYITDIIVDKLVILELKSVEQVLPLHEAQLLIDLRLAGCRIGLSINFNSVVLTDGVTRKVR